MYKNRSATNKAIMEFVLRFTHLSIMTKSDNSEKNIFRNDVFSEYVK